MPEVTEHGETGYRYGCKCAVCRAAKAADTQARRHARLYGPSGPMGPMVRRRILAAVKRGATVIDAARTVGVTHQRIYAAARGIPEFGEELERLLAQ